MIVQTSPEPHTAGLELALLGLLRPRPMHAYELYQQVRQTEALGLIWHLKQSNLYALLAKLERAGLLTTSLQPQGTRPPRKVYAVTPAGQAAFAEWLATPVAHGREFRLEFLVKLYCATREGRETAAALLERQRQACQRWRAALDRRVSAIGAERPFERLVLQFRRGQIAAILPWLDQCAQLLAAPGP